MSMKVSGPGSTSGISGPRRSERTERRSGEFARHLASAIDGLAEPQAVDALAPMSAVEALLAAQSVGDATEEEGRRRAVQRCEDILDQLEIIRTGLLDGSIPEDKLVRLTELVRSHRDATADPRLAALLDEIELRAAVELAKLGRDAL